MGLPAENQRRATYADLFALDMSRRRWMLEGVHRDVARVRAAPFDAVEIDLASLWAK